MPELVHLNIRPHLVSFLFNELEGETQATYENKKVKLARISRSSILGKMLETFKSFSQEKPKARIGSYSVFLTITECGEKKGLMHEKQNNNHKILELRQDHVFLFNEFLENIFRISIVEFIKGYAKNSTSKKFIDEAIDLYMQDHNLYLTEIDPVSIKRFYYNTLKKKHSLTRLQNQIGNRSIHYYSA